MTYQNSGRSPTMVIGFGPLLTPSRMRIPSPPQNRTTFTLNNPQVSGDLKLGNPENQPAAPGPHVVQLLADLIPQVPGQDKDVVRPGLGERGRRVDRDVGARQ